MLLVSTTLTGHNADIIGDAIASAKDLVDLCLVIDTTSVAGAANESLAVAKSIAKEKYVEKAFPWKNDFAAARNFALEAAHELGGTWALTLDTDERLQPNGEDLRALLASTDADCVFVRHSTGLYMKERFFRLPARSRYVGPTHEAYPNAGKVVIVERARFSELDKTPEQYAAKHERDARLLDAYSKDNPWDPRWFYYLGDTLQVLRRFPEAIKAYEACANLRGWNEESAWACYRAAECWIATGKHERAVDACAAGLARHAGIAELAWLAGFSSWELGRAEQAVWWSHLAIAMGFFRGRGADVKRIGFRNLRALYEGPYDVLRFALRATGDVQGAEEAERTMNEAIAARRAAWPE